MLKGFAQKKNISERMLRLMNITESNGTIFFPVYNKDGKKLFVKYRHYSKGEPIKNPKGGKTSIYGANLIGKETKRVYVCEGETDMLALNSMLIKYNRFPQSVAVTSTSGVMSFKSKWLDIISKYMEVVIVFDNDEPGHKGMRKIWYYAHEFYPNVSFIFIEKYNDMSELCGDEEEFVRQIQNRFVPEDGYLSSHNVEFTTQEMPTDAVPKYTFVTDDMTKDRLQRAKEVPFESLHVFRNNKGICPFHNDTHPSLYLWKKDNRVSCFVCDLHLDTVGFIQKRDNVSFLEAIDFLIGNEEIDVDNNVLL